MERGKRETGCWAASERPTRIIDGNANGRATTERTHTRSPGGRKREKRRWASPHRDPRSGEARLAGDAERSAEWSSRRAAGRREVSVSPLLLLFLPGRCGAPSSFQQRSRIRRPLFFFSPRAGQRPRRAKRTRTPTAAAGQGKSSSPFRPICLSHKRDPFLVFQTPTRKRVRSGNKENAEGAADKPHGAIPAYFLQPRPLLPVHIHPPSLPVHSQSSSFYPSGAREGATSFPARSCNRRLSNNGKKWRE